MFIIMAAFPILQMFAGEYHSKLYCYLCWIKDSWLCLMIAVMASIILSITDDISDFWNKELKKEDGCEQSWFQKSLDAV